MGYGLIWDFYSSSLSLRQRGGREREGEAGRGKSEGEKENKRGKERERENETDRAADVMSPGEFFWKGSHTADMKAGIPTA